MFLNCYLLPAKISGSWLRGGSCSGTMIGEVALRASEFYSFPVFLLLLTSITICFCFCIHGIISFPTRQKDSQQGQDRTGSS